MINKVQRKPIQHSKPVVSQNVFILRHVPSKIQHKRTRFSGSWMIPMVGPRILGSERAQVCSHPKMRPSLRKIAGTRFSLRHPKKKDNKRSTLDVIRDSAAILGGLTGVLLAIIWMGGRFYAAGYFYFMNIPLTQMNFSIWEYGENYFLVILLSFFQYLPQVTLEVVLIVLSFICIALILLVLEKIFPTLKIRKAIDHLLAVNNRISKVVFVMSSLILLLSSFVWAYSYGMKSAFYITAQANQPVIIYSKEFRPIGNYSTITTHNQSEISYQLTGLHFLAYNNNKYYLFDELDPQNCKPVHVYVIDDSESLDVVFGVASPIDPCASKPPPSLLP